MHRIARRLRPLIGIAVFMLLWEAAVRLLHVPVYVLPAPSLILGNVVTNRGSLLYAAMFTVQPMLLGYLIAIVAGVAIALGIAFSPRVQAIAYPLLVFLQIVPKIAVAPLFIIWFGFGMVPKVLLVSLVGVSAPTFWLAFVMLAIFYGALDWTPGPGRLDVMAFPPARITGLLLIDAGWVGDWAIFRDAAAHLVLPAIVLASSTLGLITRTTRAAMLEALSQDYVRVARAKGLRARVVVTGHALPNAMLPVVTLGGLAYANLLAGAVMTETVFSWPGLGRYTFRSAVAIDFPAIMAITVIVAALFVLVNFLVDMSYALLDPRTVKS